MRETSSTYKTLRNQTGAFYEVEVIRGSTTYDIHDLYTLTIEPRLFDGSGPSIGNTYSAMCEITLKESSANWPRMAQFSVRVRLSSYDGLTKSEWLPMGTFYTDERSEDKTNGKLTITAYDGMLTYEQYWTDAIEEEALPTNWPITSLAWITMMEDAGLVVLDIRSVIDDTVPLIGLDTTSTIRDVLKTIAAAHGGNWIITCENKLRLMPLENAVYAQEAIAGIAIAGLAVVDLTEHSWIPPDDVGMQDLVFAVQSFETSPMLPKVTGVVLTDEAGTEISAGDNSGYVLSADCEFSSTQGVANLCLSRLAGFSYKPFAAGKAMLDPAAEIGDVVLINDEAFQMSGINWNLGKWITADIEASYDEEVDHEYHIVDEEAKQYRKLVKSQNELEDRVYTTIEQSAEAVLITAGGVFQSQEAAALDRQELESQIDAQTDQLDELRMHYRFDETGETIGKTNSSKSIRLSNEGINMMVDNESTVMLTQDEMLAPKKVNIPLSGSLQMGNFLFQPRSSGNMSLLWVGET